MTIRARAVDHSYYLEKDAEVLAALNELKAPLKGTWRRSLGAAGALVLEWVDGDDQTVHTHTVYLP